MAAHPYVSPLGVNVSKACLACCFSPVCRRSYEYNVSWAIVEWAVLVCWIRANPNQASAVDDFDSVCPDTVTVPAFSVSRLLQPGTCLSAQRLGLKTPGEKNLLRQSKGRWCEGLKAKSTLCRLRVCCCIAASPQLGSRAKQGLLPRCSKSVIPCIEA